MYANRVIKTPACRSPKVTHQVVLARSQLPRCASNAPTERARGASRALGTPGQLALGAGLLGAPAHPHGVGRTRGQLAHDLAQSTGG